MYTLPSWAGASARQANASGWHALTGHLLMLSCRTSLPICMASWKEEAPTGKIMNSCIASEFPACTPPLMMLKEGTGRTCSTCTWGKSASGTCEKAQRGAALVTASLANLPACSGLTPSMFAIYLWVTQQGSQRSSPGGGCQQAVQCACTRGCPSLLHLPAHAQDQTCRGSSHSLRALGTQAVLCALARQQ